MPKDSQRMVTLRYQGIFDLQKMYHFMIKWFTDRNYTYYEKKWKQKDMSPIGQEIEIKFFAERETTEYLRYYQNVEIKMFDAHDVEVPGPKGSEKKTHARFYLKIQGDLNYDWQGFGDDHGWLFKIYNQYVTKKERIIKWEGEVETESQAFADAVKGFLDMEASQVRQDG